MMKRMASILTVLALCLSLCPVGAFAAGDTKTVEYIDADGSAKTAECTVLTSSQTEVTLPGGWYVAEGSVKVGTIKFSGETHLILADGCSLQAIRVETTDLTIYGQADGTGFLCAGNETLYLPAIGVATPVGDARKVAITINGGWVDAVSNATRGTQALHTSMTVIGGAPTGSSLTIRGGVVNATDSGGDAGRAFPNSVTTDPARGCILGRNGSGRVYGDLTLTGTAGANLSMESLYIPAGASLQGLGGLKPASCTTANLVKEQLRATCASGLTRVSTLEELQGGVQVYAEIDGQKFTIEGLEDITVTKAESAENDYTYVAACKKGDQTASVKFTPPPRNINNGGIAISVTSGVFYYTGTEIKPKVSLRSSEGWLSSGTDYTVTYANNVDVGTGTVTIQGIGKYSGTVTRTFTITNKYQPIEVTYLDESGQEQKAMASALVSVADNENLESGWYVVQGKISLKHSLTIPAGQDVHLILADGCQLSAAYLQVYGNLTIYGQTGNTGKLNVSNGSSATAATIYENAALCINGGKILLYGGSSGGSSDIFSFSAFAVRKGSTFTYNGENADITVEDGPFAVNGTILTERLTEDMISVDTTKLPYADGTDQAEALATLVSIPASQEILGKDFALTGWAGPSITTLDNKTYTIAYTHAQRGAVTKDVTLSPRPTVPVTGVTLNETALSLTVGDTAWLAAAVTPADADQRVTWTSSNEAVATVDSMGDVMAISKGSAVLTAQAGGFTATCTVTVAGRTLTPSVSGTVAKPYDGTTSGPEGAAIQLAGVQAGDDVTASASFAYDSAAVGTRTLTASGITLAGADAGKYSLASNTAEAEGSITQASAPTAAGGTMTVTNGAARTYQYSLNQLLPTLTGGQTFEAVSYTLGTVALGDYYTTGAAITGAQLSLPIQAVNGAEGTIGTIQVTISSTNFADMTAEITVNSADKTVPEGAPIPEPAGIVYGQSVGTVALTGEMCDETGPVAGTFTWDAPDTVPNAGSYSAAWTFTPADPQKYLSVTGTMILIVEKAVPALGLTASPGSLTSGGTVTLTLTGLPEGASAEVSCSAEGVTVTPGADNRWTADLPSGNQTYTFAAAYAGDENHGAATADCSVSVRPESSGGTGGGGGTTTPVPSNPPVSTGTNTEGGAPTTETTAKPSASTQGTTATTTVDASMGAEIVKQAVENDSEAVVIAPSVTGTVSKTEVSIPAATVGEIGSQTSADLTVSTPVADVTIPNGGLGSLSSAGGTVTVAAEQQGNRVELSVRVNGQTVDRIPGGVTLAVSVDNTAPGTVAVLVREDGTQEVVRKSVAEDGSVTVPLDGSAKLEIVDNSKPFADVPKTNWAADAVAFVSAHELFHGTAANQFSPNAPMSRGMLAVVLHNLESNPAQSVTNVFDDVGREDWYAEGVAWAAANGIVTGYSANQFAPNDNITREQLAVMLWRYVGSPAAGNQTLSFTDADQASSWAIEALRWAVEKGILNGKGNGILDPGGNATRAETAQLLQNFLRQ